MIESQWRLYVINVGQAVVILMPLGLAWMLPVESWTVHLDPIASFLLSGFMIDHIVHFGRARFPTSSTRPRIPRRSGSSIAGSPSIATGVHAVRETRSRRSVRRLFIEVVAEFEPDARMGEVQA